MSDQGASSEETATASGRSTATTGVSAGGSERDWTFEVTDRIESVVGVVRDKTTVPITKIAQAVVFGVVVGTLALAALILVVIALLRVVEVYLPFDPYGRRVWIAYAAIGAIFLLAGLFCWSKRTPRKS